MSELCVGIDLGTTNSLIGAVIDGKLRLFPDGAGNDLLPSVVGADGGGKLLIGRAAKNQRLIDPEGTSVSVKRRMGTGEQVRVGARSLSPPQVSALILGALLDRVEAALGRRPTRAVITVPAFFSDAQRQATRDAGALAGLTVERLVNEPTAAAMTYQTGSEQTVMVYDLGGAPSMSPSSSATRVFWRSWPAAATPGSAATTSTRGSSSWCWASSAATATAWPATLAP